MVQFSFEMLLIQYWELLSLCQVWLTRPIWTKWIKQINYRCLTKWKNIIIYRSSHWRCSIKKCVLKNFAKFTGKHLHQRLFFNNAAGLRPATLLKKRLRQRFFLWILRNFWGKISIEHIWATASIYTSTHSWDWAEHFIQWHSAMPRIALSHPPELRVRISDPQSAICASNLSFRRSL